MGLRQDNETLCRYIKRGLGREYLMGTLAPEQRLDPEPWPIDPDAANPNASLYAKIINRGD